jgi:predicted nucleic acid-binding Zn ribbon protein
MNHRRTRSLEDRSGNPSSAAEEPDPAFIRRRGKGRKSRPFPFVTLSAALQGAVNTPVMKRRLNAIPIAQEWRAMVGETVAEHVQPSALDKGILTLEADSSVWRQQINFEKKELLKKVQARIGADTIKEIRIK